MPSDQRVCEQCGAVRYGGCPCKKLCKDCSLAQQEEQRLAKAKLREQMEKEGYVGGMTKKMAQAMGIL